jgi:hypothetical protein
MPQQLGQHHRAGCIRSKDQATDVADEAVVPIAILPDLDQGRDDRLLDVIGDDVVAALLAPAGRMRLMDNRL